MINITSAIQHYNQEISGYPAAKLIAISKTKPAEDLMVAYQHGQRIFGENKVQEMVEKHEGLPKDIQWHMVGHLQRNKVKYIAPFVDLIHSVDSPRLLLAINKEATKANRIIDVLLQVHIATETTKFGFSPSELVETMNDLPNINVANVRIVGLMGMATNTENKETVEEEFKALKTLFEQIKTTTHHGSVHMAELSMGMSGDYKEALENGSTMIRIGSAIFGERNYV
ncbi:MAG: pyridoxal phosphate enzyme (YggS family) [Cyclobacteriaceae bacterium]|jgi:pyridoxal phosphate enzyme (YggS family)